MHFHAFSCMLGAFATCPSLVFSLLPRALKETVKGQLMTRLARQAAGEDGRPAFVLMAEMMQLQELQMPVGVLKAVAKSGAEELLKASWESIDAGNLLASLVHSSLVSEEPLGHRWALSILEDSATLQRYALPLCRAVLRAALVTERERCVGPARCLGRQPLALAEAVRELAGERRAELFEELLAPCAAIEGESFLPAVQAFGHKQAKVGALVGARELVFAVDCAQVRIKATKRAAAELEKEGEEPGASERQQLMASLALQRTEDENQEVVACVLEQEALWSSEKVPASAAVSALLGVFQRPRKGLLGGSNSRWLPRIEGETVEEYFVQLRPLAKALQAAVWLREG